MTLAKALLAYPEAVLRGGHVLPSAADPVALSAEAMIVFDLDGVVLTANPAARALYGPGCVAPGRHVSRLGPLPTGAALIGSLPGGPWQGRLDRCCADGAVISVQARRTACLDARGAPAAVVEFTSAASRVDPAALRASEARYRNLFQRAPIALMLVGGPDVGDLVRALRASGVTDLASHLLQDPDLFDRTIDSVAVTEVNDEAVRMFGAAAPADLIRSVRHLWMECPDTFRRAMIARFDGVPYFAEETRMCTLDGRIVDVLFSLTFPSEDLFMGASLMGMVDITERLRAESEWRQVSADFSRAASLSTLGEMATSIAHEVKQPLSAILTNAQTTGRWLNRVDPNLEKASELLRRIAQSARRAGSIIDRVQDRASARPPAFCALDLNATVREAVTFTGQEMEGQGVRIDTVLDDTAPLVLGDRVQLQQIVVNLLLNSVQAMAGTAGSRRRIRLTTRTQGDSVGIRVRDSGPGIPSSHLDQVFDGFFTTKAGGLGIGLAICRSIITAHGGRITAANHRRGGAVFEVLVPIARLD